MKKLMIAAAIVCAAAVSHAAVFNWISDDKIYGIDTTGTLSGNGFYAMGDVDRLDWESVAATYTMTLYQNDVQVGVPASGDINWYRGAVSTPVDYTAAEQNTAYTYDIVIVATQESLQALGVKDGWDYSGAYLTQTISRSVTTEPNGATEISPTFGNWEVRGAVEVAPIPEPTSGLLLLLGVAGMALRRRRA